MNELFEQHRQQLHAVAFRILGSRSEADDALQEAWLRVSRSGMDGVENSAAWLTTVVSRVCLTMLDSRKRRREEDGHLPDMIVTRVDEAAPDPEREALLADAVGSALTIVLDTLSPAERIAFVLHDLFGLPFDDIARVLDRSPDAARQLASRARRRVRGGDPETAGADRAVVNAFLAAARGGSLEDLLALLDPEIVLRADFGTGVLHVRSGPESVAAGARAIGPTRALPEPILADGLPAVLVYADGAPERIMRFTLRAGRIAAIDVLAEPSRVARLVGQAWSG
ncbi:sigma-70 family RNA polymerase sigma factor [Solirubrobacter phytolaccae]|uniref:Sigma-70 family RNA polymerase sigma factor n=1 Tax=Solirubrobacter phytolaccae TaxID=1404360 RepID=A0A9X3N2X2_9ACTN|nr:sigma-70 family RNA polymerase sigma factor [Solirubrobacter phytolaccae]MDA0178840.1 sigma-70 family RNA polymerase sigma factor [Solirubrobacter phytolaccae]